MGKGRHQVTGFFYSGRAARILRQWIACVFLCLVTTFAPASAEQQKVTVLGYDFPPYVTTKPLGGLTPDLVGILNRHQSAVEFRFRLTSAKRRYKDLAHGRGDIVIFEMPEWGWSNGGTAFVTGGTILTGAEIFVARHEASRGQAFFDNLKQRDLAGHQGYHYRFANYNANQEWLHSQFRIHLSQSHETNIALVLSNKVDIAVLPEAFFLQYLKTHPERRGMFLVANARDQEYRLKTILREDGPIAAAEFDSLLGEVIRNGKLPALLKRYGLLRNLVK